MQKANLGSGEMAREACRVSMRSQVQILSNPREKSGATVQGTQHSGYRVRARQLAGELQVMTDLESETEERMTEEET